MTEVEDGRGGGGDGLVASTSERRDFPAFPFEPYPIQLDLMRGLYRTLERGGIGVFESPTGTGKTLSVLCSALQWLEDHRRRLERGEGGANGVSAATRKDDDEPDWLRDYEKDKSARDFAERMKRRLERRRNARRAAAADVCATELLEPIRMRGPAMNCIFGLTLCFFAVVNACAVIIEGAVESLFPHEE